MKKVKKVFHLEEFMEPLMEDESYFTKRMFGGLSVYYKDLMIFTLAENPGDREFRGEIYSMDLWNGVLVCTDYKYHEKLQEDYPLLVSHPVIKKWLYLPMGEGFEESLESLIEAALGGAEEIGIVPGSKNK